MEAEAQILGQSSTASVGLLAGKSFRVEQLGLKPVTVLDVGIAAVALLVVPACWPHSVYFFIFSFSWKIFSTLSFSTYGCLYIGDICFFFL